MLQCPWPCCLRCLTCAPLRARGVVAPLLRRSCLVPDHPGELTTTVLLEGMLWEGNDDGPVQDYHYAPEWMPARLAADGYHLTPVLDFCTLKKAFCVDVDRPDDVFGYGVPAIVWDRAWALLGERCGCSIDLYSMRWLMCGSEARLDPHASLGGFSKPADDCAHDDHRNSDQEHWEVMGVPVVTYTTPFEPLRR